MFETVKTAPPDPILGLSEAFAQDPRPHKINLAVGVYKDAQGGTPVLAVVKQAERVWPACSRHAVRC
jgi:aspartate/tyrosine/aromatic aminotransferase